MPFDIGLIPGIASGVIGGIQSLVGGGRERRATRALEKHISAYRTPTSILDYYNKALQRYNANPYTSALYNQQQEMARAGTAQGIASLQDRRSALGGVSSLVRGQNDALLKAAATAEGQQAQALGQLGQASAMKGADDRYKFEQKANLLAMKAGGGARIMNAGLQNIYGGLGNLSNYYMAKNYYGGGNGAENRSGGGQDYDYISNEELNRYRQRR